MEGVDIPEGCGSRLREAEAVLMRGRMDREARGEGMSLGDTARRMFHWITCEEWLQFCKTNAATWSPRSLSREGFVHLSFRAQLQGTLEAHYADTEELFLVEVTILGEGLVIEASRGGALFPHVYRPIKREEFLRQWRVTRLSLADEWTLPDLGKVPREDTPPGAPVLGISEGGFGGDQPEGS